MFLLSSKPQQQQKAFKGEPQIIFYILWIKKDQLVVDDSHTLEDEI